MVNKCYARFEVVEIPEKKNRKESPTHLFGLVETHLAHTTTTRKLFHQIRNKSEVLDSFQIADLKL